MLHVKKIKSRRYCYRSKKVNGKVVFEYVGPEGSPKALLAQIIDDLAAGKKAEKKLQRKEMIETEQQREEEMKRLFSSVTKVMKDCLKNAGFYQHDRGEWRRRRMTNE